MGEYKQVSDCHLGFVVGDASDDEGMIAPFCSGGDIDLHEDGDGAARAR